VKKAGPVVRLFFFSIRSLLQTLPDGGELFQGFADGCGYGPTAGDLRIHRVGTSSGFESLASGM